MKEAEEKIEDYVKDQEDKEDYKTAIQDSQEQESEHNTGSKGRDNDTATIKKE